MVVKLYWQRSPGCSGCQRPGDQFTGFVFLGISVGTGIVISTGLRGKRDFERLQKAVGTVITVTISWFVLWLPNSPASLASCAW